MELASVLMGRAGTLLAVSLVSLALANEALAQQPTRAWPEVLAGAKKEGRVVYYSAANPTPLARMVAAFKKTYPEIAIEFQRLPSGPLLGKLEQERNSGIDGADVANATEIAWFRARAKEGRLLNPSGPAARDWPANYLLDGSVVVASMEPFVISYNTKHVTNPPKTYADLLRPEFRGRIGLSELASTAVVAFYDWAEKTQGSGYWMKLREQNPKFYVGSVPIGQAVASGEVSVGGFGVPTAVKPLKEQGAPIEYVVPSPGLGIRYGLVAFGWSKRPNASLVLLDFLMSREGQAAWNTNLETASPLPGIPGSLPAASIEPYDPANYPPETEKKLRDTWTRTFKQ